MSDRQTDRPASAVSLVIPCRPEYVGLCRLVAGALGTRDMLDEEVVADLKVAVTEACNCLLAVAENDCSPRNTDGDRGPQAESASPRCSIRMDFESGPEAFVISALFPERRGLMSWLEACDPMSEAGLGFTILKALTDELVEFSTDEATGLRLTRRLDA